MEVHCKNTILRNAVSWLHLGYFYHLHQKKRFLINLTIWIMSYSFYLGAPKRGNLCWKWLWGFAIYFYLHIIFQQGEWATKPRSCQKTSQRSSRSWARKEWLSLHREADIWCCLSKLCLQQKKEEAGGKWYIWAVPKGTEEEAKN